MSSSATIKPVPTEIPEGEVLTGTVTFRNRVHNDHATFVVTLDLPQGRIEACSGISFARALHDFGLACSWHLPKMIRALPKNAVVCTPLGWLREQSAKP